jgi:hypothetical protein
MAFERIPAEMRAFKSWCVWRLERNLDGKLTKIPYSPISGYKIDPTAPHHWVTFESAVAAAESRPEWWSGIGFVLSEADPYTFIDLDEPKNPDGSPLESDEYARRFDHQNNIFNAFPSYSELSPSGKGLHIILRGEVPAGRKRNNVEIYSSKRFMTMTGNVYTNSPINYYNNELKSLWDEMAPANQSSELYYAGLEREVNTDEKVILYAQSASNGELFHDLYFNGDWAKHNYPSQSEADFALVDIIAFYSRNRAQVNRIFLNSRLGQREKSRAPYRIKKMLDRCFDNLPAPIDIQSIANNILASQMEKDRQKQIAKINSAVAIDHEKDYLECVEPLFFDESKESPYNPPPGLMGDIARFVFAQSYRPIPEVSLAAAIGLMAGVCGRAFNTPTGSGLNQYVLVLAPTGCGKEEMAKGIQKLFNEVGKTNITSRDFLGPSDISSPQALTKYLGKKSASFVSIIGEFGIYFKNMATANASPHMQGLSRALLDFYGKSGNKQSVGSMIYSDSEKNTAVVNAPAMTILAESVPENFYLNLNESMIQSGLLPRFTIIDYKGDRVRPNKACASVMPSDSLIQSLNSLMSQAALLNSQNMVINVQQTEEGRQLLDKFEEYADNKSLGANETVRSLWTRAYLKSLRLACLVAVGVNSFQPTIDKAAAEWAIRIIRTDVEAMLRKFESGEVGENTHENEQIRTVLRLVNKYVNDAWEKVTKTVGAAKLKPLHDAKIVPYTFLQKSTSSVGLFKNDKIGATAALKRTLNVLCERGDLQAVPRAELAKFGTGSAAYAITNIDAILNLTKN